MKNSVLDDVLSLFTSAGRLIESVDEFNEACEHVARLLEEAVLVYEKGGYSTSVFLSITAIEETAKAHLGVFSAGGPNAESRKGNAFYDHGRKHKMAALPTVAMGDRLQQAIGQEGVDTVMKMSHDKQLLNLRESALYFERRDGQLVVPRTAINKSLARMVLLFAIEVFDDALVGMTNYSMELSQRTNALFQRAVST